MKTAAHALLVCLLAPPLYALGLVVTARDWLRARIAGQQCDEVTTD